MNARAHNLSIASKEFPRRRAMLGQSGAMLELNRLIERVGPTDASVLITGECGSGKELVAQLLHAGSQRANSPFVAINCGAIPAGMIEAELFGYEKGSFTGAGRTHAGVFERAEGGTLFLDEIAEIPLDMQTRLLRVLETQKFYRVGGLTEMDADVRVIAASSRCPLKAVQKGQLREDILYRLAVFAVAVPPLRERGDDIVLLAEHFLAEMNARDGLHARFSQTSRTMLTQHNWPGNVRELKNCVERAFILCDSELELAPLISEAKVSEHPSESLEIKVGTSIGEVERSLIEATLKHFRGNKRRTADTLGCSLKTLYNKLHVYARAEQELVGA
jgi:DNA-binding NtrC family response regulator